MTRIAFTTKPEKVPTINVSGRIMKIGVVQKYEENSDGTINIMIEFDRTIPGDVVAEICANPGRIGIVNAPVVVGESIILP